MLPCFAVDGCPTNIDVSTDDTDDDGGSGDVDTGVAADCDKTFYGCCFDGYTPAAGRCRHNYYVRHSISSSHVSL